MMGLGNGMDVLPGTSHTCCAVPVWRRLPVQAIAFFAPQSHSQETTMANDHIYKQIELVGSSTVSSDDAISQAIARASSTLRELDWFEVTQVRGHIKDGKVAHWQVVLKIGMRLQD
jgi:flavin-binding protein dodecin